MPLTSVSRFPRTAAPARSAFTLVEMVVVVAIIAVLAGILLPALAGAQRRARKTEEMNTIRQVGTAWELYNNANDGWVLPGYLPTTFQDNQDPWDWNVTYKYDRATQVDPEHAAAWPLRLGAYLDFNHDALLGYRDDLEYPTAATMPGLLPDGSEVRDEPLYDTGSFYPQFDASNESNWIPRPLNAALFPAFGYNAFFVGGWYELVNHGDASITQPMFNNVAPIRESDDGQPVGRISVVARSAASIQNSSKLILFASSTQVAPGEYERFADDRQGCHYVIPRWMECPASTAPDDDFSELRIWYAGATSGTQSISVEDVITVLMEGPTDPFAAIPMGRHTGNVAAIHADLHVEAHLPGRLEDQQYWINGAKSEFRPSFKRR